MAGRILQGSVFDVLPTLKPSSIDVVVTSPPYWALRSYLPKGHPLKHLELGSEKTPAEFIANMVRVFDLVRVAMADHATCWINIGDTYSAGDRVGHGTRVNNKQQTNAGTLGFDERPNPPGLNSGNLCLIPQRLTIALQDDGWIVRSYVIWHKPAPMPASVSGWAWRRCRVKVDGQKSKDRRAEFDEESNGRLHSVQPDQLATWQDCPGCKKCKPNDGYVLRKGSWRPTSSYEPILMLAKSSNYFCDGESVKTPCSDKTFTVNTTPVKGEGIESTGEKLNTWMEANGGRYHPNSANLRDVWRIAAEPLSEGHYAAYPTELVRRCLQAGTSAKGYCPTCGGPWVRMLETTRENGYADEAMGKTNDIEDEQHNHKRLHRRIKAAREAGEAHDNPLGGSKTIGWKQSCTCPPAETRPGLVLDPFAGSGRTGIAANRLGLDFVGVELHPGYVEMSQRLLKEESPLFS